MKTKDDALINMDDLYANSPKHINNSTKFTNLLKMYWKIMESEETFRGRVNRLIDAIELRFPDTPTEGITYIVSNLISFHHLGIMANRYCANETIEGLEELSGEILGDGAANKELFETAYRILARFCDALTIANA